MKWSVIAESLKNAILIDAEIDMSSAHSAVC
jgi:hypothetical protein